MLRLALTALLTSTFAPAQERCACGAYIELPWTQRIQRTDGSMPVAASKDVAKHAHVDEKTRIKPRLPGDAHPHRPEDLHVTAFYALVISADGSTLRAGPYQERLKNAVRWVRKQQDERGRFGFSRQPDWLIDHALVTTMLAEVVARSGSHWLLANVDRAFRVLQDHFERAKSADVEVLTWVRMAIAAARSMPDTVVALSDPGPRISWWLRLDELERTVARFAPNAIADAVSTDRRKTGASVLLQSFMTPYGERPPVVDVSWFDSYDHPLATAYYALASFRSDYDGWRDMSKRLKSHVVKTQVTQQPFKGSWAPIGDYGETYGRIGTTCASILTLTFYYRYARLAAVEI